jgi:hypothetical protein
MAFGFLEMAGTVYIVIASVSETIHRTAQRKDGLLRRKCSSQ